MNAGVGIGLFICLVIIVIVGVALKCNTDSDIEYLKTMVDYFNKFYHSLDKRWNDMFDIMKGQQEEIKELRRMIEPKDEKKCCCSNCKFYHKLNNQDSVCLNVHVNNRHKTETTLYADNRSVSYGTIKGVKPNECCEYYKPMEESDE